MQWFKYSIATILNAENPWRATMKIMVNGTSKEILWFIRASAAAGALRPIVRLFALEGRTWVYVSALQKPS